MTHTVTAEKFPETSLLRAALGDTQFSRLLEYMEPVQVAHGTVIVHEGDGDHATYLICTGGVRVTGVDIHHLGPGDIFGDLSALLRGPAAAIVTTEPSQVLRLSPEAWQRLCAEEAPIALDMLHALVSRTNRQPVNGNGNGQSSLHKVEVDVRMGDAVQRISTGAPASMLLPERVDEQLVVAALIDRKAVSLTTPITSACEIAPLTTATLDGQRYYRHSQALLLLEAADRVDPSLRPRLSHSLGFAQRVELEPSDGQSLTDLVKAIDAKMRELVEADVPLIEDWCSITEAREMFEARGWTDAAQQLAVWRSGSIKMVSYGRLFVTSPGPLLPSTLLIGQARLIADGPVLLLVYGKEGGRPILGTADPGSISQIPATATGRFAAVTAFRQTGPSVREQHRWLSAVGIGSVGEFNQACIDGDVSQIIRVSEGFQEKRISTIADQIASRGESLKVVAVAGPSSSGKTTFIRRLKVQLQVNGLTPVELSLDDYYCDRENTPLDHNGEYDYESLRALRLDLLKDQLGRLTAGELVQTPRYDFRSGRSEVDEGPPIKLGPTDILMLEGIHGLNPTILNAVPDDAAFRVFVCPLTQLPFDPLTRVHVSDVRLLRRIVRDRHGRSAPAADTIARWPSVVAGERLNIFPFQQYADATFDSSLIYELAVLKVYAERYLLEVPRHDPAYTTAHRLLHLIGRFVAIYPDHVPRTSLLREFIGGSDFER